MHLVDLHSHLLPGIDDGPRDLVETVATLRAAHASGVRRMVATPHMFLEPWNHRDADAIRAAFEDTLDALRVHAETGEEAAFLREMRIDLGAENYASPEFLAALARGRVLGLNQGPHLLVEFPLLLAASTITKIARQILDAGSRPVIAHVERYAAFRDRPEGLDELRGLGCVLQVNAQSLVARAKDPLRRSCIGLLRSRTVEVIASDVHGPRLGRPQLGEVVPALRGELPDALVEACTRESPRAILDAGPSPH